MRTLVALALGILIGAATLGAIWATHHGDLTVRVTAVPLEDGRVEVGVQQLGGDAEWHDLTPTRYRFLAADAEVDKEFHSSPILIPIETDSERIASDYAERLFGEGQSIARHYRPSPDPEAEGELVYLPVLCIIDVYDAGIESLCDGLADAYPGEVERIAIGDATALGEHLAARFASGEELAGVLATSLETTQVYVEAEIAADANYRLVYWIEAVDPLLPDRDTLFCLIGHGGAQEDLFWGLAGEVQVTAGDALGINVRSEAHADIADQVAALRACAADGASAIATTLPNPEALQPAISEAKAAGSTVLTFNSGAETATESGSALHIGLDDRLGGQIAGDELNARGITGNVLCIIHEETNVGLEERCDGLEETYAGTVERFSAIGFPSYGPIVGRLAEGGVDAILTLSIDSSTNVLIAQFLGETEVPHATFGFSLGTARRVASGRMLFAVLDHPEIQSYMAAASVLMVERFRFDPALYYDGLRVLIQPMIADAEDMQAVIDDLEDWSDE